MQKLTLTNSNQIQFKHTHMQYSRIERQTATRIAIWNVKKR